MNLSELLKNLDERQIQQLNVFKEELLKTNQVLNLFSRRRGADFQLNVLLSSSLTSANILREELITAKGPVLDLGSGNGFPGLVFALLFPSLKFHLCERNRKKAEFLKYVSSKAQILNTEIICLPGEVLKTSYEIILSQAALPLEKLKNLLNKLLLTSGKAFLWQTTTKQGDEQKDEQENRQRTEQRIKQEIKQGMKNNRSEKLDRAKKGKSLQPSISPLSIQPFKSYQVMGSEKCILKLSKQKPPPQSNAVSIERQKRLNENKGAKTLNTIKSGYMQKQLNQK